MVRFDVGQGQIYLVGAAMEDCLGDGISSDKVHLRSLSVLSTKKKTEFATLRGQILHTKSIKQCLIFVSDRKKKKTVCQSKVGLCQP